MDNQEYVYRETAEERAATPEYKPSKRENLKNFISKNAKMLLIIAVVVFTAYTILLGGGKFVGTWQAKSGNYTYELKLMPFGMGNMSVSRGEKVKESEAIHWEYDDTTKCLIILVNNEDGKRFVAYRVMGVDGDTLTLSQDGSDKKIQVFYKK